MPPGRAPLAYPRRRHTRDGRVSRRAGRPALRAQAPAARPRPGPGARCAAGRRYRPGFRSLQLEHFVADLDLVAALRTGCPERRLELLALRWTPRDPKAAIGAEDSKRPPARRRAVDQEVGETVFGNRSFRLRQARGQRPAELLDARPRRAREREAADDPLVFDAER